MSMKEIKDIYDLMASLTQPAFSTGEFLIRSESADPVCKIWYNSESGEWMAEIRFFADSDL